MHVLVHACVCVCVFENLPVKESGPFHFESVNTYFSLEVLVCV